MRAVCIDLEIANRSPKSICALGLAVIENSEIVYSVRHLIQPHPDYDYFHPYNIHRHGIRNIDVQYASAFETVYGWIRPWLEKDAVLVAHNAAFEITVLRKTLDLYRITYPQVPYLCTCKLARKVWPQLSNHRLVTVARHLSISFEHHNPEQDAIAVAKILLAAMKQLNTSSWNEFLVKQPLILGRIHPDGCEPCRLPPLRYNKRYRHCQK